MAASDLLETTHSGTVPLLSDDAHGSLARRRRLGRKLRCGCSCCGLPASTLGQRCGQLLGHVCPFYRQAGSGSYTTKSLVSDLLTGLTMSVFHIPQGLAYGLLAGLRPINGLYTSLIPVAIYCVLGRSRHLSLGTFSLTSLLLSDMIGATYRQYMDRLDVNETAWNDASNDNATDVMPPHQKLYFGGLLPEEYARLQVAIIGSFAASAINMVLGIFQLGFIMKYVSNPMLRGFTTAAAVHIFTSQVPMLLGIHPTTGDSFFKLIATYTGIINEIASTNWATVITSVACMVPLYLMKEYLNPRVKQCIKVPLPVELLIILASLAASHALQLQARFHVSVVGTLPRGLPMPLLPDFAFMPNVLLSSLPVSLVGVAISLSIVKMYALQFDYPVDYSGELFVLGVSSLFGSFFQCFYATGALARCAVVVGAGMQSQVASAVSCLVLLLVVLAIGPLFEAVPDCALAAVIVVSLIGLFKQVADLPKLWRTSKLDLTVWLVTAAAVLVLDVSLGLAVGFGYSLASSLAVQLVQRCRWRPGKTWAAADSADAGSDDVIAAQRYPLMISPQRPERAARRGRSEHRR